MHNQKLIKMLQHNIIIFWIPIIACLTFINLHKQFLKIHVWYIQTWTINPKKIWLIIKKSYWLGLYVNSMSWSVKKLHCILFEVHNLNKIIPKVVLD